MRLGVARSGTVMAEERTTPAVNTLMPPPSPPLLFSPNSRGSVTQDQIAVGTAMAAQEAGATIEATRKNTADVRVEEAATPTTKASDIRSEGLAFLNEPVVSETSKEKRFAKGKSTVAKKAGAGDGVDSDDQECPRGETGDETNIGCGLARLGRGKRPRDGESLRAKKDEEVVIEPILVSSTSMISTVSVTSPGQDRVLVPCLLISWSRLPEVNSTPSPFKRSSSLKSPYLSSFYVNIFMQLDHTLYHDPAAVSKLLSVCPTFLKQLTKSIVSPTDLSFCSLRSQTRRENGTTVVYTTYVEYPISGHSFEEHFVAVIFLSSPVLQHFPKYDTKSKICFT